MLFMWVPENQRAHWRISYIDYIFWRRNNLKKVSISNTKMGSRRRSRQKTLGKIEKNPFYRLVTRFLFFVFPLVHNWVYWPFPFFASLQSKFVSFYEYTKNFNSDNFDYDSLENSDYVYMRWKEHFLVPDHTIRDIHGASFAGFYYICFQRSTSSIEGYYFHRNSEW